MASTPLDKQLSQPSLLSSSPSAQTEAVDKHSYGQIFKSSVLIGGSSALNIVIAIIRTKVMAVLLGPAGFGLAGLYGSIADLTQSAAGMGVNGSGVRQIAESVGSEDTERIARTVMVLRWTSVVLGLFGSLLLVVFSRQVSILTFGTDKHALAVALLSVVVFCKLVSAGQGALIQGMRRIADLAKMNVLSALFGTLGGLALVYSLRERGIVLYLIAVAATTVITSWWYSRKVEIGSPRLMMAQVRQEAVALLTLGFAFMISGLMTLGVGYAYRVIVLQQVGLQATGLYQSAWLLGGLYAGFILQAMAADFYPRLTAVAKDHDACNRLVNEQAHVGMLLAGPGVIATLTFAPVLISLLYSARFAGSIPILRWICLGATLQVVSWPMGFIIVAKGRQGLFIFSEVAWAVVSLGLAWTCVTWFGVNGAGIAFFGSYIFHAFLTYAIVSRVSGFRWSGDNLRTGLFLMIEVFAVFCACRLLPSLIAALFGTAMFAFVGVYSLRVLASLVPVCQIPYPMRRLMLAFGFAQSPRL